MEDAATQLTSAQIEALARRIDRPIVLVGMMGVGKSTVGRKLAQILRCPFTDADEEVERAAQMSIPDIFEQFGEAGFRDGERRVISRLIGDAHGKPCVIATGGGAFVNAETRALILERAITVWLDSDVETLLERVGRKDNRPLLRHSDPRETLIRLREERAPFYAEAPLKVISGSQPHLRTAAQILKEIDAWL